MVRLGVISVLCLSLFGTVLCQEQIVSSPVGNIKGLKDVLSFNGKDYPYTKFLGIPYAESTGGDNRFRRPVKKAPFMETYDATQENLVCVQNSMWNPSPPPSGEDCLNLNIFLPESATPGSPKPVMLFIYGGGFQEGYQNNYGIGALPVLNDVVYITINYRLHVLGFLAHPKYGFDGNYGLWDQHMAIQWVHNNIASFGGDPNRVTVFGESAGGASVTYQALYNGNIGLFQGFIAESGVVGTPWSYMDPKSAETMADEFIATLGCDSESVDDVLFCLKMKPSEEIAGKLGMLSFVPIHDGHFVNYDPAKLYDTSQALSRDALTTFSNFNAIIGVNSDEAAYYVIEYAKMLNVGTLPDDMTHEAAMALIATHLGQMKMQVDESIRTSLLHEYTDFSDPRNPEKIVQQMGNLLSDMSFIAAAKQALGAHAHIENGKGTYMYFFEHRPNFSMLPAFIKGANHMDEIPFVMGFPETYLAAVGATMDNITADEMVLSTNMMSMWSQFARTGNPNPDPGSPAWPMYDGDKEEYIVFNTVSTPYDIRQSLHRRQVDYWVNVFPDLVAAIGDSSNPIVCAETSSAAFVYPSVCLLVSLIAFIFA